MLKKKKIKAEEKIRIVKDCISGRMGQTVHEYLLYIILTEEFVFEGSCTDLCNCGSFLRYG